ncbi:hypothetical protein QNN00_16230 [Bacillus velezensis]|nr:hypothetical protein [Bacillus velezensis]
MPAVLELTGPLDRGRLEETFRRLWSGMSRSERPLKRGLTANRCAHP